MSVKLSKCLKKGILKFNKNNLPVEGNEVLVINCPVCNKLYRAKGTEKEPFKSYNKPCKHIVLHLAPDFNEAVVDKDKIYDIASFMNDQIDGGNVESIALALYEQTYPNQIIKRYSVEGCHGCADTIGDEYIVFSK